MNKAVPNLIDVTLRDGGFVNCFSLDSNRIRRVVARLASTAADIVELGYMGGLPDDHGEFPNPGPSYDFPPQLLGSLVDLSKKKCAVMLHPERFKRVDFDALIETGITLVRLPSRPGDTDNLLKCLRALRSKGVEVSVNLILVSWWRLEQLMEVSRLADGEGASMLYLADTNSSLKPLQVSEICQTLASEIKLPLGFHAHDGKGLALANVHAAVQNGAGWIDGSVFGLGRGAGNAPMEVLVDLYRRDLRLLRRQIECIPDILSAYCALDTDALWKRVCSLLDLSPPCARLVKNEACFRQTDPFQVALSLFSTDWTRPLKAADFERALAAQDSCCSASSDFAFQPKRE